MDGLARSVGDGIAGLVAGAVDAIGAALGGIIAALSSAVPAGALPVIGVIAVVLIGVALVRR